jgi:hypothetical protein
LALTLRKCWSFWASPSLQPASLSAHSLDEFQNTTWSHLNLSAEV